MIIYLPCRLGENFIPLKFKDWVDGKRVYVEEQEQTLKGFSAMDCQTRSLAIPTIFTDGGSLLSYDPLGEFSQEFVPKYKISVDVKEEYKLSVKGFPGNRTVRLSGLLFEKGSLMAEFITGDRYEHLRFPIKDNIQYVSVNEEPPETVVEYCKKANKIENQLSLFDFINKQ